MSRKVAATAFAVVVATFLLEGVQHLVMLRASMTAYHAVSAALTLLLVGLAAWQLDARVRLAEATARAEDLEQANSELERAARELLRSDRLAAVGAVAAPLCERLRSLLRDLEATGRESALLAETAELLHQFESLVQQDRKAMRPVDFAALCGWVTEELAETSAARVEALLPPTPVWVKANPGRLEMALRHFVVHAAESSRDDDVVVVVSSRGDQACAVIAGPGDSRDVPSARGTLNQRIAQAVVTECGGSLTSLQEHDGYVHTLRFPLGPSPGGGRHSGVAPPEWW